LPDYDDPIRIWHGSLQAYKTARWYSSWLLVVSLVPVFFLYCVWIPLTCSGQLDGVDVEPTIEAILPGDPSAPPTVAVQVLQSLLPPLNEPEDFIALPRSNTRSTRAKRAAQGGHFDPNRFHYPSPFLAQASAPRANAAHAGSASNAATSSSSSSATDAVGGGGGGAPSGHDKKKVAKHRKEKKKQKTGYGMARNRGERPRRHSDGDVGPSLESDESTTSEEDDQFVAGVLQPNVSRATTDHFRYPIGGAGGRRGGDDDDGGDGDDDGLISGSSNSGGSGSGSGGGGRRAPGPSTNSRANAHQQRTDLL
jgi:hypothetical protein